MRVKKTYTLFTTPKQLRNLAQHLERKMEKTHVGENLPTVFFAFDHEDNIIYELTIDQDQWNQEKREERLT